MNQTTQAWTLIDPKRLMVGLLLAVAAAIFASVATAAPASAGGDSGSGTGGGSCSISYGWRFVTNWNAFNASGQSCGSSVYNSGKSRANLAQVGAASCYDNRNQLDAIWYLTGNSARTIWLQYPSSGRATKSEAINFINGSGANGEQKDYGRAAVNRGGTPVVLVCTWPGQRGVTCNDLPEWDTKVQLRGANGGDRFRSREAAINNCILSCPTLNNQASDGNYRKWVRSGRSDTMLPRESANGSNLNGDTAARNENRGEWCFSRPTEQNRTTEYDRRYQVGTTVTNTFATDFFPYTWRTEANGGLSTPNPHPGPTKLQPQCAQPTTADPNGQDGTRCYVYTPFGELLNDAVISDNLPSGSQVAGSVNSTNNASRVAFDLSENNATALAEGGILNVVERTTRAAIIAQTTTDTPQVSTRTRTCQNPRSFTFTYTRNASANMTGTNAGRTCGGWSGWGAWQDMAPGTSVVDLQLSAQTPEVTGFWQALANHCYATGYNSAMAGNEAIANGDDSKTISASAVTPKMNNANAPVWGPNSRYPQTAANNFFDRECAFNGVREGAAQRSSNTHFRDNELRNIMADLFVPESSAVVDYQNEPAITTTVTRWNQGTPQVNGLSNKGAFRMEVDSDQVFTTDAEARGATAPVQRNWDSTEFASRNLSIMSGEHTTWQVAGNWPSDQGKPEVFTFKWEYAPNVGNTIPTENVGFASPRGARSYTAVEHFVPIQGKVYSRFDSDRSPAVVAEMAGNTGSGVRNDLDGVLYWGAQTDAQGRWTVSPDAYQPYYQVLKFVRSTTE